MGGSGFVSSVGIIMGGLGAEPPVGVQGAEPPMGVQGGKPPASYRSNKNIKSLKKYNFNKIIFWAKPPAP